MTDALIESIRDALQVLRLTDEHLADMEVDEYQNNEEVEDINRIQRIRKVALAYLDALLPSSEVKTE